MTTLNTSATQPNVAAEKMHERPTYYTTLVRSGYALVNCLQMYYEIHGTGKPLVTIHPVWGLANVFPQLVRHRQLIAVELQGHGRTADIDRPLTFEQHADDVAALLKHLQIEQADVFGVCFGGIVAVMMAVRHPDLIGRVATYGTLFSSFGVRGGGLSADDDIVQFQRESYEQVAPDPTQWPTLFAKLQRMEWQGFSHDELKSITAPILIASGDHDFGPVEHSLEMSRLILHAQLAVIPDASHYVLNVDPEKLLPTVAAFLDEPTSTLPYTTPQTGYHPGVTR